MPFLSSGKDVEYPDLYELWKQIFPDLSNIWSDIFQGLHLNLNYMHFFNILPPLPSETIIIPPAFKGGRKFIERNCLPCRKYPAY